MDGTANQNLVLTELAWDAIEGADTRELAFAMLVASLEGRFLPQAHLVRALLESTALRRFVMERWEV